MEHELRKFHSGGEEGIVNIPPQEQTYRCQYMVKILFWEWRCHRFATEFCRYFCFGIYCDKHIAIHRLECMDREKQMENFNE